jgi:hypothetical protein
MGPVRAPAKKASGVASHRRIFLAVLLLVAQLALMYALPANPEKRGIARVLVLS